MKHYLLIVEGDIEPEVRGPFETEELRDEAARAHKRENGDNDGIFGLDVDENGVPATWAYSSQFLDGEG